MGYELFLENKPIEENQMKTKKLSLKGLFVALVTPFNRYGEVDYVALEDHIEYLISNGVAGIVPCGTTGEASTLTHEEHRLVIDLAVRVSNGRVPVIAGTGSNNTIEAIGLTKHAYEVGADGVLVVVPYYNRPSQEGLYQHFCAIAEAVPEFPIVLYNIPKRTGINMIPRTVARLARIPSIIGIKEASGDLAQMSEIMNLTGPEFELTCGDDALTLRVLSLGGVGVISVLANIMPREVAEVIRLSNLGLIDEATKLNNSLAGITEALFIESNPVPVKTVLGFLGKMSAQVRLPLCQMENGSLDRLKMEMRRVGLR